MPGTTTNLQLHFKEFIKADSCPKGVDRIKSVYWQTGKNPDHTCDLLVYEPKNIEEAQLGTLFMLGKIENIPKDKYKTLDFLLSLLISVIKREFYSDHKRSTSEALESSLNKANLYLTDFAEKGNVEWIGNISFICGAFCKNTLHITQAGESIIKLFRGTNISHIENKFPANKKAEPLKTFGNVASGTMLNGDKIILGTKNILNIAPLTNLKELSKRSREQIIEGIKLLAEKRAAKAPVICLVLEAKTDLQPASLQSEPAKSEPAARPVRKKIAILPLSKKLSIFIFLGIYKAIYKAISLLAFVLKKMYRFLTFLFKKIFKSDPFCQIEANLASLFASLKNKLSRWTSPARTKISSAYCSLKQNRPAFFAASLLIILLLILPFFAAQKINYYIKIAHFNKLSAEIEEVQKKTDAALIYSEKEKAKGLLQKNQILLAGLLAEAEKSPFKNSAEILSKTAVLQEKYQEQQDSINNVIRIKELEEILDFSDSGFIVNPVGINKIKEVLYFYELDSGILYKYPVLSPPAGENNLILVFISAKDEMRKMVSLEKGQIALFGQSGKVYLYNSDTNDRSDYSINPAVPVSQIADVKSFLSNFYILNAEQGSIIKYSLSQIQENTIKGSNWLSKPAEEPNQARSMAIDGSIYILDSNGLITKYYRGEKTEEIKPLIEKPLADNAKIFTDYDFANLYISDPQNKRLLVLNKKGEVINQYVNNEFSELKDFLVTNDEKEIYLLCGTKVYKINI